MRDTCRSIGTTWHVGGAKPPCRERWSRAPKHRIQVWRQVCLWGANFRWQTLPRSSVSSLVTQPSGACRSHCHMDRTWGVLATTKPNKPWQLSWHRLLPIAGNCWVESSSQLVTLSKKSPHLIVHPITSSCSRREKAGEQVPVYLVMSS